MKKVMKSIWPFMCPFCDELAYPIPGAPVRRDDKQNWSKWQCEAGHEFYCYEKVCTHQDWAEEKYNNQSVIDQDKKWRSQLRKMK